MLSLCHRKPDGSETIISVHEVTQHPSDVVFYRPQPYAEQIELREGVVFVMNELGKTITRYNIT